MKNKKREISSFNLAFLDIMFCGFGAVVLLVLIINSHIVTDNKIKTQDLTAAVDRVRNETRAATIYHSNIKSSLQDKQADVDTINQQLKKINTQVSQLKKNSTEEDARTQALKKQINKLQADIKAINQRNTQQKKKNEQAVVQRGNKVRRYEGEGHRQYLTGLKLGGKRVLFLIDNSASMLDETIVNIIVKRNFSDAVKKTARKWQQAVKSVKWMAANLPASSQFAIVSFNKKSQSLTADGSYKWTKSTDSQQVNSLFKKLSQLVPQSGTNLYNAFTAIKKFPQQPDNIILITDGLPTLGKTPTNKSKVSAAQRISLFEKSIKKIPRGIPVNSILLPMEGDPMAAALFWKLAIDTKGSFITPSRDWP